MKYIICQNPEHLSSDEKSKPVIEDGNALLKVNRVGICGTDLHAFKGNQPFFSYPRILGHELSAEVVEIGDNPQGLRAGDKVAIIPYVNCGTCVACKAGKTNCCQRIQVLGVHTDGGMQEFISIPARLLLPANEFDPDEIAIIEPLAIGAHALRRAQTKAGDSIVVMGCGPIGLGIIQLAKYIGATVFVIDMNEKRLEIAKTQFQADHIVHAQQEPVEKIKELTHGDLVHSVFDATGSKQAIESGIHYMRHGGNYILVGLTKGELAFHHPSIHAKETTLMCSRNATLEDFHFVMKVLREKKFNTQAYITKRVNFESIPTGFNDWTRPDSKEIKVMTTWD